MSFGGSDPSGLKSLEGCSLPGDGFRPAAALFRPGNPESFFRRHSLVHFFPEPLIGLAQFRLFSPVSAFPGSRGASEGFLHIFSNPDLIFQLQIGLGYPFGQSKRFPGRFFRTLSGGSTKHFAVRSVAAFR
jgi:hypothetical protein